MSVPGGPVGEGDGVEARLAHVERRLDYHQQLLEGMARDLADVKAKVGQIAERQAARMDQLQPVVDALTGYLKAHTDQLAKTMKPRKAGAV